MSSLRRNFGWEGGYFTSIIFCQDLIEMAYAWDLLILNGGPPGPKRPHLSKGKINDLTQKCITFDTVMW